jgi:hypothetical protein
MLAFLDPPYPVVRDPVGWKRVQAQLSNLVGLLTEDGFAILRTPWPFFLEAPAAGAAPVEPAKPERRHGRKERSGARGRSPERWALEGRDEEEEAQRAGEFENAEGGAERADRPATERVRADLSLPNAAGPETHVYHSTAVHLYMRKPG